MKSWEARAGDAARRLSEMARRFEEIAEERAVIAAKPAALMREIEGGEAVRQRLGEELAAAEAAVAEASEAMRGAHSDSASNVPDIRRSAVGLVSRCNAISSDSIAPCEKPPSTSLPAGIENLAIS